VTLPLGREMGDRLGHVTRLRWFLVWGVGLLACRTPSQGFDERTEALLRDYRRQRVETFEATPLGATDAWEAGQYTVHATTDDRGTSLERVAVGRRDATGVWLSLQRLGPNENTLVRLKVRTQGNTPDELARETLEAWVRRGERPEQHYEGAVPREVIELFSAALQREPGGGAEAVEEVPAGRFEGCRDGRHGRVPLSGVVRQRANRAQRELVDFGFDGGGSLL
jgi:hypothetical protein